MLVPNSPAKHRQRYTVWLDRTLVARLRAAAAAADGTATDVCAQAIERAVERMEERAPRKPG